jgi:hypothetical protein
VVYSQSPSAGGRQKSGKIFFEIEKKKLDIGGRLWYINQAVAEKAACTLKIEQ